MIEVIRNQGVLNEGGEPQIWAMHAISPSTNDDARWERYVKGLVDATLGIIRCPFAALGMRQLRPALTPTHNLIVRALELVEAGVHLRLGSDNIADMCSQSTTSDLTHEVFTLSAAIRYYKFDILANIAARQALNATQRAWVATHLEQNAKEISRLARRWMALG